MLTKSSQEVMTSKAQSLCPYCYLLRTLFDASPERGEGPLPRRDHVQEVHLRSQEQHPRVEFPAGSTKDTQVKRGGVSQASKRRKRK